MASIQIKTTINLEELILAVEQLNFSDLEQFTEKVVALRQRKQAKSNNREAVLLAQIQQALSTTEQQQLIVLQGKTKRNESEQEELGQLVTRIENMQAQRILALGELAEIRKQSVDALSEELGFKTISYV